MEDAYLQGLARHLADYIAGLGEFPAVAIKQQRVRVFPFIFRQEDDGVERAVGFRMRYVPPINSRTEAGKHPSTMFLDIEIDARDAEAPRMRERVKSLLDEVGARCGLTSDEKATHGYYLVGGGENTELHTFNVTLGFDVVGLKRIERALEDLGGKKRKPAGPLSDKALRALAGQMLRAVEALGEDPLSALWAHRGPRLHTFSLPMGEGTGAAGLSLHFRVGINPTIAPGQHPPIVSFNVELYDWPEKNIPGALAQMREYLQSAAVQGGLDPKLGPQSQGFCMADILQTPKTAMVSLGIDAHHISGLVTALRALSAEHETGDEGKPQFIRNITTPPPAAPSVNEL